MTIATEAAVGELEADVRHALVTGDQSALRVLGYGEISVVVGLEGDRPAAAKRLPEFRDERTYRDYETVFHDHLTALARAGVEVLPSELVRVPDPSAVIAYCVQPRLDAGTLGPAVARTDAGELFLGEVVRTTVAAIGPELGLDAQLSNWARVDDRILYLDVTTPLLRDDRGAERVDVELFLASLPAALRPVVRRYLLDDILATYRDPRRAVLDLASNLLKERLAALLPPVLAVANELVDPPITDTEVRANYSRDARMWELLQRLRRVDRAWQRRVRRRPYPFLLPPDIDR